MLAGENIGNFGICMENVFFLPLLGHSSNFFLQKVQRAMFYSANVYRYTVCYKSYK